MVRCEELCAADIAGMCVRKSAIELPAKGEGKEGDVGATGEVLDSAMGSRERENVDVEAFGVAGSAREEEERMSWSCNWPSTMDCLRA